MTVAKKRQRAVTNEPPPEHPDDPGPTAEVEPEAGPPPDPFQGAPSEIDRTREFVDQHGSDLRYCYPRKSWLRWTGSHWSWDAEAEVGRRAEETAKAHLAAEAMKAAGDFSRAKAAMAAASVAKREAMVKGARHHLAVAIEELDSDPWLLATETATIDLRTGEAREHIREDMITQVAPVRYDPKATCPRWERFLAEVLVTEAGEPDPDLVSFVQRAVGYSLTGATSEQCLFLLIGPTGANGKSVLLGVLSKLLADYSATLSFSTLLADRHGRSKGPELLPLLGSRLAAAVEPNAGQRLDEALVKKLTGEDEISVNPKYERVFSFENRAKLWLGCNAPPTLSSGGSAMARRLRVIPFRRTFIDPAEKGRPPHPPMEAELDRGLEEKLRAELPGILRWAVQGALEWQRRGLAPPESVRAAEADYQAENDPIAEWLAVYVRRSPGRPAKVGEAHRSYAAWCEAQGWRPVGPKKLAGLLRQAGFDIKVTKGHGSWLLDHEVTMPAAYAEKAAEPPPNDSVDLGADGCRWVPPYQKSARPPRVESFGQSVPNGTPEQTSLPMSAHADGPVADVDGDPDDIIEEWL